MKEMKNKGGSKKNKVLTNYLKERRKSARLMIMVKWPVVKKREGDGFVKQNEREI